MKATAYLVALIAMLGADSAFAGNVQASIQGGNLYVYGDDDASSIVIDSPLPNRVRVRGRVVEGQETTVNSGSPVVLLANWTGGIFVYLYGGTDVVKMINVNVTGAVVIDVGSGNDDVILGQSLEESVSLAMAGDDQSTSQISMSPLTLQSTLVIIGGEGNDYVQIDDTRVQGTTTIDLGDGVDELYISDSEFGDSLIALPGAGQDTIDMYATDVALDLTVDDPAGKLIFDVADIDVGRNVFIYGTSAIDFIRGINLRVVNLMQVFSEGANDVINLRGSANTLEVFAGAGYDRVLLTGMIAETVRVFLDSGVDSLTVEESEITLLNAYGGTENDTFVIRASAIGEANIYGDEGSDTFRRGGGSSFNSLNLYSIETEQ